MQEFKDFDLFEQFEQPRSSTPRIPKETWMWIAGGLCALAILPSFVSGMPQAIESKNQVKADLDKVSRLQVDAVTQEELAKIAEARYTNGCRFVVSKLDPTQAAALGEGANVIDLATNTYLPSGTVVCDFVGNTAVLDAVDLDGDGVEHPAATDFAFTGNTPIIQAAMQRAGFAAQINQVRN